MDPVTGIPDLIMELGKFNPYLKLYPGVTLKRSWVLSQRPFPKRQLPTGIFPSGNFPNVHYPKLQLPNSQLCPSRSLQPHCSLRACGASEGPS